MEGIEITALWRLFLESESARAGALAVFISYAVAQLKPYLPTGKRNAGPNGAVENRYVPWAVLAAAVVLNPAGAWLANSRGASPAQSVEESIAWGITSGLALMGVHRAWRLTTKGDPTERERAAAVTTLRNIAPKEAIEVYEPGVERAAFDPRNTQDAEKAMPPYTL